MAANVPANVPAVDPVAQLAALQTPPAVTQNTAIQAAGGSMTDQEVIVIVRDRNNPNGRAQVMNLQPSAELLQTLQRYSR